MFSVVLVIHLIVTVSLVGIILLQRSEGGGLGVGGSGNADAMAPRAQADILTKTTGFLAALFILTSLTLVILGTHGGENASLVSRLSADTPSQTPDKAPGDAPVAPAKDAAPAPATSTPAAPAVPIAK